MSKNHVYNYSLKWKSMALLWTGVNVKACSVVSITTRLKHYACLHETRVTQLFTIFLGSSYDHIKPVNPANFQNGPNRDFSHREKFTGITTVVQNLNLIRLEQLSLLKKL